MGTNATGIVFRATTPIEDFEAFLSTLLQTEYKELPKSEVAGFSLRRSGDLLVEIYDDVVFIYCAALASAHVEHLDSDIQSLDRLLGSQPAFTVFCQVDSVNASGYVFVEHGVRIRSRFQPTEGLPVEFGNPTPLEQRWLSAKWFVEQEEGETEAVTPGWFRKQTSIEGNDDEKADWEDEVMDGPRRIFYLDNPRTEVAENALTAYLLSQSLFEQFGVCPWTMTTPAQSRYFRDAAEIEAIERAASAPAQPIPWWKKLIGR